MSFFDSFKEEARQRKYDKYEAQLAIEKETEKIKKERTQAREEKNIFRKKVKLIDKIVSDKEDKEDLKKIQAVKVQQDQKIREARAVRSAQSGHTNKIKIGIIIAVFIAIIAGGASIGYTIHNINVEKAYGAAVEYILQEDYQGAVDKLSGIDTKDSKLLLKYASYQTEIKSFKGKADEFNINMKGLKKPDNQQVQKQIEKAIIESESAYDVRLQKN